MKTEINHKNEINIIQDIEISNKKKAVTVITVFISLFVIIGIIIGAIYLKEKNAYNEANKIFSASDKNVELDNCSHTIEANELISLNQAIPDNEYNVTFDNGEKEITFNANEVKKMKKTLYITLNRNKLFFKKLMYNIALNIVDTTPPKFTKVIDEIKVLQGEKLNIIENFKADDLSGNTEIHIEGKYDTNKVGEYKIAVLAVDESGNTSKKEITVVVNENNGTENSETTIETSRNLPNTNNATPTNKNQVNSSTGNKKPSGNSSSSNSKPSNNKPSNGGGSSNSKPSKPSTGGTSSGTTTKPSHCTNNENHSMSCGNMGKWFNSRKEVENYTSSERQRWKNKYLNGEISWEEYTTKAPCGYECWSCSYCGKWTGNFKYD